MNSHQRMDNEQFPVLYEDGTVKIYKNPTNEIFVKNLKSGAEMRITPRKEKLELTTHGSYMKPCIINGSIGYTVSK